MYQLIIVIGLVLTAGQAKAANSWVVPVKDFTALEVNTAIAADVVCSDENKVVVETTEYMFERLDINVRGGELEIARDINFNSFFNNKNDPVFVTVYTSNPLDSLQAYTAGEINVESCAVDADSLEVRVSTGARVNVAGQSKKLNLKVSTGGDFNSQSNHDELQISEARIKLSTGAHANLCAVDSIAGKLSTGANVYASSSADIDVRLGTGAHVSYSRCQVN